MAKSLSQGEVRRLALVGAESRLETLRAETQALLRAFPELARSRGRATADSARAGTVRKRRRWKMSAEQKKAVSDRMRRYWAARRKEKGK